MKKLGIISIIICMIFIVSFFVEQARICTIDINNISWKIELASTSYQKRRGLMNREQLCSTCGMLFIFDDVYPRNFWMKNTLIPLDMYFYDSDGKLVDMAENMRPEKETEYPMDYTSQPAQYVIEVPAGSRFFEPEKFNPQECL